MYLTMECRPLNSCTFGVSLTLSTSLSHFQAMTKKSFALNSFTLKLQYFFKYIMFSNTEMQTNNYCLTLKCRQTIIVSDNCCW